MAKKKSNKKEVAELEKSYTNITGKEIKDTSSGKGRLVAIIGGCVALVLAMIAMVVLYLCPWLVTPGKINNQVRIAGVDVTGMTRLKAIIAVSQATKDSYSTNTLVMNAGETTVALPPELSAISLDIPAAVDAACNLTEDRADLDLTPYFTLDEDAIKDALSPILEANTTTLQHSTYQVTGTTDTVAGTTDMRLVIQVGQAGINSDIQMLYEAVMAGYSANEFTVDYILQMVEPNAPDWDEITAQYCIEPVDAVMDMETFTVSDHAFGCTYSVEDATQALAEAEYNQQVTIPFQIVEPEHTKEEVSSILYRDELGSYTAYSGSRPYTRDVNLKLSCDKINGTILLPGDVFDYNKALGERTAEGGWKKADGYANGDTVSVYGGGICQASSCLYYCTLIADVEVVTRYNHSYISSYMPPGMDATVSWKGPEFLFKNTTEYPIRIDASAEGGNVTVKLMGTDTKDYYVKMEYAILSSTAYETVYEEMTEQEAKDQGHKDGDQLVSGYTGYKVVTYKCKYNKETDELISRDQEVVSTYKKRDRVLVKVVEPEKPTEPSTTPPSTEAPTAPPTTEPPVAPPTTEATTPTEPELPPETTLPTTGGNGSVSEDN